MMQSPPILLTSGLCIINFQSINRCSCAFHLPFQVTAKDQLRIFREVYYRSASPAPTTDTCCQQSHFPRQSCQSQSRCYRQISAQHRQYPFKRTGNQTLHIRPPQIIPKCFNASVMALSLSGGHCGCWASSDFGLL